MPEGTSGRKLIDANALTRLCKLVKKEDKPSEECCTALDLVIELLEGTPTVDAVEVVHGHWCWEGKFKACSKCGSYVEWDETLGANFWKFCPYCGAKMDGDGNG